MSGVRRKASTNRELIAATLREKRVEFEAFVRSRVRPGEVDDVLQLAAMKAVERAGSLDDPSRVAAWLYRIHRNVIIDTARKRGTETRVFDTSTDVPGLPDLADASPVETCACSVVQAGQIAPSYAAILSLVDIAGVTVADAAAQLDISVNNATVRLHRARKALRKRMLEHCGVEKSADCVDCRCVYDGCCPA